MEDKDKEGHDKLLKTIRDKRRRIDGYLQEIEPRGSRLTNRSILFGGIATLLTAAQLPFGEGTVKFLQTVDPPGGVSVWQLLAVGATICSGIAAIAGAMYKQQEIASRLAKAQSSAAKLEGLDSSLDLHLISLTDANTRYTQYIAEIPFVSAQAVRTGSRETYAVDSVKGEITSPAALASVPRAFRAAGWAQDVGPNVHLWLAVEADGLMWPKDGRILPDESGSWTATVFEDGATELFRLSLLAADRRATKQIEGWLNSGKRSGTYGHLKSLPGTRRVWGVDGLRLSR